MVTTKKKSGQQVVRAGESYTVGEFCERTNMGHRVFRNARRRGLKVVALGQKRYVRGADWLAFLSRIADEDTSTSNQLEAFCAK